MSTSHSDIEARDLVDFIDACNGRQGLGGRSAGCQLVNVPPFYFLSFIH
jgi:hypothetical protein